MAEKSGANSPVRKKDIDGNIVLCENSLSGKKVALFGSYGWGDGEWMRDWEDRCNGKGINIPMRQSGTIFSVALFYFKVFYDTLLRAR